VNWDLVADIVTGFCLLTGASLCLAAAIGILRFPDLLTRMHAATKPQVLGILLLLIGVGLQMRSPLDIGMVLLVAAFQLITAPVSAHMVGRAAYRTGNVRADLLRVDDLSPQMGADDDRA
jgi:multicomponent Na+:H+ antiporter subunit G